MASIPQRRLTLVGAGIQFPGHLTVEGIEALDGSDLILSNLPIDRLLQLPPDLSRKAHSVWDMHVQGAKRINNYRAIAEHVLKGFETVHSIAWLTQGHPRVFDSVSAMITAGAIGMGVNVVTLPGVSCIDTLIADVGVDPASGLVVHEATSFVRRGVRAIPEFALLLLQPSSFMSDTANYSPDKEQPNFEPLVNHLLNFYPPAHEVLFVRSSMLPGFPCETVSCTVGTLSSADFRVVAGSTLFVPPVFQDLTRSTEDNGPSKGDGSTCS